MVEDATAARARPSRRAVLAGISLSALPLGAAHAQAAASPPVFRSERWQFTLLEPASLLPTVMLADLKGRPAPLVPPAGKVMLINIWASWCAACQIDLPLLARFHAARPDVAVAAVCTDRVVARQSLEQYLLKLDVRSLPVFRDQAGTLVSEAGEASAPLRVMGMPVTYLITPSAKIAGYIQGVADWLTPDAQRLLDYYVAA
ncbi:TlpA disulfide reductase family protein [Ancylobacter sp. WKF20]|uniref:TlpA family protein disulfide reductase n=1 Tax=Ancylobacter sp. WKF20 TaxID=3039801 RepID=UPI00243451CC|nr:TlpA disulfide reductase family protein [Ancylobacter sp. WKF20]WGD29653.1 TlpA disulfide reductase family protein [Ancylobacter sp. WKF20]